MRPFLRAVPTFVVTLAAFFASTGCDRSDPKPAVATPAANPAPAASSANESDAVAAKTPTTEPIIDRQFSEDLTLDPVRDPLVREKAKELKAIPVAGMKDLKVGDEVIVLVRGDKGGGTIYGSGPYTIDSQIRKAVIHNGALQHNELGLVRVKVIKFEGDHVREPRNGITPTAYGKYHTSYTIEKIGIP